VGVTQQEMLHGWGHSQSAGVFRGPGEVGGNAWDHSEKAQQPRNFDVVTQGRHLLPKGEEGQWVGTVGQPFISARHKWKGCWGKKKIDMFG